MEDLVLLGVFTLRPVRFVRPRRPSNEAVSWRTNAKKQLRTVEMSNPDLHRCVCSSALCNKTLRRGHDALPPNKRHVPENFWDGLKRRWHNFHSAETLKEAKSFQQICSSSLQSFHLRTSSATWLLTCGGTTAAADSQHVQCVHVCT